MTTTDMTGAGLDRPDAQWRGHCHPLRHPRLTPSEIEVLSLIARGASTRQVAHTLGITAKTAGTHIERIYTKTGALSQESLIGGAELQGTAPLWAWIGDEAATTFSY